MKHEIKRCQGYHKTPAGYTPCPYTYLAVDFVPCRTRGFCSETCEQNAEKRAERLEVRHGQ